MNVSETELAQRASDRNARRVTPADIQDVIVSAHYFTAAQGADSTRPFGAAWPEQTYQSLGLLTLCVLVLRNGFTVTGESACADPAMFDADIRRDLARLDAERKVWSLLGYALRCELSNT